MRRSPLSLYTPLLIIVLVQALIIAVAPSRSAPPTIENGPVVAAPGTTGTDGSTGTGTVAAEGSTAGTTTGESGKATSGGPTTPGAGTGTASGTTSGSSSAGTTTGDGGSTGGAATSGGTTGSDGTPQGDTSHCTPDGKQHDVIFHAPPCVAKWEGGDNGGATWRGVTGDKVTVVLFRENKNEQVTALLNLYQLRATRAEDEEFMEAAEDFVNEYYEFYGREVDFVIFDAVNCPETPPDEQACRIEAQRAIAELDPFLVVWPTPVYPDVFEEFKREQVISVGGWHHDNSYFAGNRPYRYDVFMDGTRSADVIIEYACKKLPGNATHAGETIHPSFPNGGAREDQPRKFGIIVPEPPATLIPAERAAAGLRDCGFDVEIYSYASDINQAQSQSTATITSMIADQVTTAICMCDPIAPIFRTQTATRNNYFPEWLVPGLGLLDYDLLGRLYDKPQMVHAFGPSHLQLFPALAQTDASRVWRASGRSGSACPSCNLNSSYFTMVASMIHNAGPVLTPQTVERGSFDAPVSGGWAATGGDPTQVQVDLGPNDYTLISDFKEVYWREDAISRIDGKPGAYVPMYGGQRWTFGQLPSLFEVPQPSR